MDRSHVTDSKIGLLLAQTIDRGEDSGSEGIAIVGEDVVVGACPVRPTLLVAGVVISCRAIKRASAIDVH